MAHWTEKFFIARDQYWLYVMNRAWKYAPLKARMIVRLLKKMGIAKGRILELGCGNGRISTNLAKRGFDVTGIDLSPVYIEDAKKRARQAGVNAAYVCGDIRRLDRLVRGKFDAVYSIWTAIGYYDRRTDERIFAMAGRRLRKGGIFMVLDTMSREWLLNHYCPAIYEDVGDYLIIHRGKFDRSHSRNFEHWNYYRKQGRDLIFEAELDTDLRIYAHHEITEMAERAGMKFETAFDNLALFDPVRPDSRINMVFKRP